MRSSAANERGKHSATDRIKRLPRGDPMTLTIGQHLTVTLRTVAQAFAPGDQVAPCALLWTDPERLWTGVIPELLSMVPELYQLGSYDPVQRSGPALWLRCIEARVVVGAPATGTAPIFYLPGVSREQIKAAEDCPSELAPLVELQYRGAMWMHVNGKEWTPYAFLVSKHGGLDLDVTRDQATLDALAGALPTLLSEPVAQLHGRRLDSEFFNGLIAPDAIGLLLRWMSDPDGFEQRRTDAEWKAFCQQCKGEVKLDPVKDGPLKAAGLLAARGNHWAKVWQRFAESPSTYDGIVEWLKRAAPKTPGMFDSPETWPTINESEEQALKLALETLADSQQDQAIRQIRELEARHAERRNHPWRKLGMSPMATALEPLAQLAELCAVTPGAPTPEAFAAAYAKDGWMADAKALAALAACTLPETQAAILGAVRSIYLPWVEGTARHLQHLIRNEGQTTTRRGGPIDSTAGRLVLFADGLRMDVAHLLTERLEHLGIQATKDWEWSAIPSVTATAKPAASPIAGALSGINPSDEFSPRLTATGQPLTHGRFLEALKANGWQILDSGETGNPTGCAWTECGSLDKRGHNEGWKLARSVGVEVQELASRIKELLHAGWQELLVVTDHGWLLMPGGLPKVELKAFFTETRWSRCAALKTGAHTDVQTYKWSWNPTVMMACPPGAGSYLAGVEYAHGGVSLQESVIPVLRISGAEGTGAPTRVVEAKWTGAKCRVTVSGNHTGMRIDIRGSQTDPTSSFLTDKQAREITSDGRVTVFLEDDGNADSGIHADVVLLDSAGRVVHALSTVLGA